MKDNADTALALSLLSYFPELSHGGYRTVGDFLDEYFTLPEALRPETMFSGLCPDETNGVVQAMKILRRRRPFRDMRIICDSTDSRRFNSFCAVCDDTETAFVVIGGNYRMGFYRSGSGITSSWCDNFIGAVRSITAEQKDILEFYDSAAARLGSRRIIVCGHSKGGNLAQFITLMRGSVDVCFSFDGQGFSEGFIRRHEKLICKRGDKIVSICPRASIVGASLAPIPNAKRLTVTERPMRKGLLYSHIPASLFDKKLHLGELGSRATFTSRVVGRLSVRTVRTAQRLPLVSAENGLGRIGKALQYIFKDDAKRGLSELVSPDVLALFALLLIELPVACLV